MKIGDVIWIRCKGNIYCSEIKDIIDICGPKTIHLYPIIGNISGLYVSAEIPTNDVINGLCYERGCLFSDFCSLSYDVEKLV